MRSTLSGLGATFERPAGAQSPTSDAAFAGYRPTCATRTTWPPSSKRSRPDAGISSRRRQLSARRRALIRSPRTTSTRSAPFGCSAAVAAAHARGRRSIPSSSSSAAACNTGCTTPSEMPLGEDSRAAAVDDRTRPRKAAQEVACAAVLPRHRAFASSAREASTTPASGHGEQYLLPSLVAASAR